MSTVITNPSLVNLSIRKAKVQHMRQEFSFYDVPMKTCKLLLYLKVMVITLLLLIKTFRKIGKKIKTL